MPDDDTYLADAIQTVMPGFTPVTDDRAGFAYAGMPAHRTALSPQNLPLPTLVQIVFEVLGAADLGRAEKLDWEFEFEVDGIRCSVASQKFGLYLYVSTDVGDEDAARPVQARITGALVAAQRVVERQLLRPLGSRLIAAGEVTVRNQHYALRQLYDYFRDGARLSYSGQGRLAPPSGGGTWINPEGMEGWWNTFAMITAYFSYLEHTLVACLPLSGFDPAEESVLDFLGSTWAEKYRRILAPSTSPEAMSMFNRLHGIAERYRNTYSHGGFDKAGATIAFQLGRWGALPAALSDVRSSPHFEFLPSKETTFDEIRKVFDDCDQLLKQGSARDGMRFAESGLDIRFDARFRARLAEARARDDIEGLLDYLGMQWERAANMDW